MRIISGTILAAAIATTANASTMLYEATPEELESPARSETVITNFPTKWPQKRDRLWVELWCADSGEDPVRIIVRGGKGRNGKKGGGYSSLADLPEKGRCAVSLPTWRIIKGLDFDAVTNVTVRTVDGEPRRFGVVRLMLLEAGEEPPVIDEAPRPHVRDAAAHHECYLKFKEECRRGAFVVGQATSMENIRPRAGFKWRDAEEVCVRLARGERESVQLLVSPVESDLKDVKVEAVMDDGFAATNVAACIVGYVETRDPAPYKVRIDSKIVETPRGWWPDPILDFQKSCDIAGEDVQSFWVRVTCPTNQHAGTYTGRLVISASNAESISVRLKVRVNDFSIGNVSPLPLAVSCIYPNANADSMGGDTALAKWLNTNPESYLNAWKTREEKYCDFLANYYLTPDNIYLGNGREPRWDMLVRLRDQGRLGTFCLGYCETLGGLNEDNADNEGMRARRKYLHDRYAKAKELGIADHAYIFMCDEMRQSAFPSIARALTVLRREFPGVPIITTANDRYLGTGSSPLKDVNHCPLTCWMDRPVRKAQAEGRQVWWYICNDPPAPEVNAMMEGPPVELRLLMGAMTQRVKIDGFLYWSTMRWNSKSPITKGPFTDWNPKSFGNYRGDGQWMCCGGPDLLPIATLRLENFRDGLEDLWYARILEQKRKEVESGKSNVGSEEWIRRAKAALVVPRELVRSPGNFSTDPAVLYRWRSEMAVLIEEASAVLSSSAKGAFINALSVDDWHSPVKRKHDGIPSLAVSGVNGRMWATWYTSPTGAEDSNNYLVLSTSADGGATWREAVIYEPDFKGPVRAFDPELWIAPDGNLRWTWTEREVPFSAATKDDPYAGCAADPTNDRLMMVEFNAEREPDVATLSASGNLRQIARGVMMCKPIVAKDGAWLFPVAHWQESPSASIYASTDGGRTFVERGGITLPKERRVFDEHNLIELSDGTLRAYIRVKGESDGLWEAESCDGGRTWGEAHPSVLPHVCSRVFVRRLTSGNLLMVKNGLPGEPGTGRRDMTAYISEDDGKTWPFALPLDTGRAGVSYPDGQQLSDGRIVVAYDFDRMGTRQILFASFREEDVVAGRFKTADATPRRTIYCGNPAFKK